MSRKLALAKPTQPRAKTITKRIERWHKKFLKTLAKTPSVTHACLAANVNRTTAYEHRNANKDFARKWQEALDASIDKVELRLFQLATEGEPRLIEFLLRCHRPEIYRERTEVGIVGGVALVPMKMPGAE
jgi:hypothetical protein